MEKILKYLAVIFAIIGFVSLILLLLGQVNFVFSSYLGTEDVKYIKEHIDSIIIGSLTLATFIVMYLDFRSRITQNELQLQESRAAIAAFMQSFRADSEREKNERSRRGLIREQKRNQRKKK